MALAVVVAGWPWPGGRGRDGRQLKKRLRRGARRPQDLKSAYKGQNTAPAEEKLSLFLFDPLNFKFTFILHACGKPVLGARISKEFVKISNKMFIVFHGDRSEKGKKTKSSVNCVHNSVLDARVYQSSVTPLSIPGVRLTF